MMGFFGRELGQDLVTRMWRVRGPPLGVITSQTIRIKGTEGHWRIVLASIDLSQALGFLLSQTLWQSSISHIEPHCLF